MKKLIDPAELIAHIKEAEDTAGVSFAQHIVKEYLDKIPEVKTDMSFDCEYALREFRGVEEQTFNEGEAYRSSLISHSTGEQMLQLINLLEKEIKSKK